MKKILLVLLLFTSFAGFGQGGKKIRLTVKGSGGSSFVLDTITPLTGLTTLYQNGLKLDADVFLSSVSNGITPTDIINWNLAYDLSSTAASLYSVLSHTHTFASLTSKPTTIAGYNFTTDFNTQGDARWQAIDFDLTSIAALSTNSFGRGVLITTSATDLRSYLGLGTLSIQSGTFSGTSSGTNTGDQTNITGNAGTTTALQTARLINGVSFNGTADISILSAPSFTTPTLIGGTNTTSSLTLMPTSNVGTTGSDIVFGVGNGGSTEAMRILNSGFVGIGNNNPSETLEVTRNAIGQGGLSAANGLLISNYTAATSGTQQSAPALTLRGQGWKTNATAGSKTVDWSLVNIPISGAANPSSSLNFYVSTDFGTRALPMTITSGGALTLTSGINAGGALTLSAGGISCQGNINTNGNTLIGGYQSGGSSTTSHLFVSVGSGGSLINTSVTQELKLGSLTSTALRMNMTGSGSLSTSGAANAANFVVGTQAISMSTSTAHQIFANVAIKPILINTASSATVDGTASLYIEGAASAVTGAANNYALWIDAGVTRLDGKLNLGTTTDYADNAAALAGGLIVGDVYRTGDALKIVH